MGAAGHQIRQSRNVPKVRVRLAGRIKKRTPDPRNPNKRLLRPGENDRNPPSPCSKTFYRSRHGADGSVTLFALFKGSEPTLKPSTEAADIQLTPTMKNNGWPLALNLLLSRSRFCFPIVFFTLPSSFDTNHSDSGNSKRSSTYRVTMMNSSRIS